MDNNENVMNGKKDVKFEDAMTRLEKIVADLESGKCDLDEALGLFEEGVGLVKICSAKLDAAAQKVSLLTSDGEREFAERDGRDDG